MDWNILRAKTTSENSPRRGTRLSFGLAIVAALALVAAACVPPPAQSLPRPNGPAARNISFPLEMSINFSDTFGAPRSGGRTHEGEDLMAPKMTRLIAVADGEITWMRWSNSSNGGNILVLTDDDGWEYWYIHLNNDTPFTDDAKNRYEQAFADGIQKGQRVKEGEPIGFVGDSGNAENTGSHVHFEIHHPNGHAIRPFNTLAHSKLFVRSAEAAAADRPLGTVDTVTRAGGNVTVTGWGIDKHEDDPVEATLFVNGNPAATKTANLNRGDLAAVFPGRGINHGYSFSSIPAPSGAIVCVVLHSIGGGGNLRTGCTFA